MEAGTREATVIKTGDKVVVFKLREPHPTPQHVFCNYQTPTITYTAAELKF